MCHLAQLYCHCITNTLYSTVPENMTLGVYPSPPLLINMMKLNKWNVTKGHSSMGKAIIDHCRALQCKARECTAALHHHWSNLQCGVKAVRAAKVVYAWQGSKRVKIWISCNFYMPWNVILLLIFKKPFKNEEAILGYWECATRQWPVVFHIFCGKIDFPSGYL